MGQSIYIFAGFALGFALAWFVNHKLIGKLKKEQRSTAGLLESEKLMKEKLKKENAVVYQMKESIEAELSKKLKEAESFKKMLDEDIILLQKNNEETEALLKAGQPELHTIKVKLIEANNTIARYKAQLNEKLKTA